MPRILTMNGDHQSVATAPLDLSTTNRERRSAGASRTLDCRTHVGDARLSGGSPAPPACTGTDSLHNQGIHRSAPDSKTSGACKRTADGSLLKLPIRKRPVPLELDQHTQSHPAESVDPPPVTDCRLRTGLERDAIDSRVDASAATSRRVEDAASSPNGCPIPFLRPLNYGHYQVLCFPPVPKTDHLLVHQPENFYHPSITLATRQDEDGDTALHIAVVQGESAMVCKLIHLLLVSRRSLDIYNNLRQTPLHLAVITKQANMVDALLRAGADPAALDRNGQTALHLCCEYDQQDCLAVVLSLSSSSTFLEIKNYEGLSPLHLAVLQGRKNLAQMLLDARADINTMDIKSGLSPLIHAVETNNTEMVYFLIENGCDVNSQSYSGNTALHSACGRGQVDTVRLLLRSGADNSLKNYHNDTPVMVAKNKKITDVLRRRGGPKQNTVQEQHCLSVSPHGSSLTENGSPSPSHSRGCSPLTPSSSFHYHHTSHSPNTPASHIFPFF